MFPQVVQNNLSARVRPKTLNDAIMHLEKCLLSSKLYKISGSLAYTEVTWIMNNLNHMVSRKIRLSRIIERTNLLEDPIALENWREFDMHINLLQEEFFDEVSKVEYESARNLNYTTGMHLLNSLKSSFLVIDNLLKFKLSYYRSRMEDLNIICDEVQKSDLILDFNINDPKNFYFRLYVKNKSLGARFKNIFIKSFGFDDFDVEKDLLSNDQTKVLEKLKKRFYIKSELSPEALAVLSHNVANSQSTLKYKNTIEKKKEIKEITAKTPEKKEEFQIENKNEVINHDNSKTEEVISTENDKNLNAESNLCVGEQNIEIKNEIVADHETKDKRNSHSNINNVEESLSREEKRELEEKRMAEKFTFDSNAKKSSKKPPVFWRGQCFKDEDALKEFLKEYFPKVVAEAYNKDLDEVFPKEKFERYCEKIDDLCRKGILSSEEGDREMEEFFKVLDSG